MAQKFSYERAAMAIAESESFGDSANLTKYGINQSTLWRWRVRALEDPILHESASLKKRMLVADWQKDATQSINTALCELTRRIPLAETEEDAKLIHAIAGACKVVGELKITAEALNES
jgi:hypothetical protein